MTKIKPWTITLLFSSIYGCFADPTCTSYEEGVRGIDFFVILTKEARVNGRNTKTVGIDSVGKPCEYRDMDVEFSRTIILAKIGDTIIKYEGCFEYLIKKPDTTLIIPYAPCPEYIRQRDRRMGLDTSYHLPDTIYLK